MVKVVGIKTRKVIRLWLNNYQALVSKDVVLTDTPINTGPKAYDGVSNRYLNFLMLEAAIAELPPAIRACVVARWVERKKLGEILRTLEISKSTYYDRCDKGVDIIYFLVNGKVAGYLALVSKLAKKA